MEYVEKFSKDRGTTQAHPRKYNSLNEHAATQMLFMKGFPTAPCQRAATSMRYSALGHSSVASWKHSGGRFNSFRFRTVHCQQGTLCYSRRGPAGCAPSSTGEGGADDRFVGVRAGDVVQGKFDMSGIVMEVMSLADEGETSPIFDNRESSVEYRVSIFARAPAGLCQK